jgi:DNA-binding XRE family transcriptional regulator
MPWLTEAADPSASADTHPDIDGSPEFGTPQASSLGAGELILVRRELTGLSQRRLAARVGTSQPTLALLETGNRIPTLRTLLRIAEAAG